MIRDHLRRAFLREIDSLRVQLDAYPHGDALWATPHGIGNSGGNLLLHLAGNLQFFIGHELGGIDYTRDREFEFSARDLPLDRVRLELDHARRAVDQTLQSITTEQMEADYPMEVANVQLNTQQFLVHLLAHCAYHLGQIDYHRRLVTGQNVVTGALSIPRLLDDF